ncbi:hypothetical protein cand_015130 [Cryptosporidium andersoni]|uniref:Uncharacterized protein n=1 Tax=Cryptosporidium andersoni TaxID=117008 RepID=A0A1J4MTV9_9CRYT|nr:hypothetical protein cand_015130 [Cryptosporidium andersoni]
MTQDSIITCLYRKRSHCSVGTSNSEVNLRHENKKLHKSDTNKGENININSDQTAVATIATVQSKTQGISTILLKTLSSRHIQQHVVLCDNLRDQCPTTIRHYVVKDTNCTQNLRNYSNIQATNQTNQVMYQNLTTLDISKKIVSSNSCVRKSGYLIKMLPPQPIQSVLQSPLTLLRYLSNFILRSNIYWPCKNTTPNGNQDLTSYLCRYSNYSNRLEEPPNNKAAISTLSGWIPSCSRCFIPGFHAKIAWLIPPICIGRGGRLKRKNGFLQSLPQDLVSANFSFKSFLTVESSHLLLCNSLNHSREVFYRGTVLLHDETEHDPFYYIDKDLATENILDSDIYNYKSGNYYQLSKECFKTTSSSDTRSNRAVFCGFVSLEIPSSKGSNNQPSVSAENSLHTISTTESPSNQILFSEQITCKEINESGGKFITEIGDCDVLLDSKANNTTKALNVDHSYICLLIPRFQCSFQLSEVEKSILTFCKPCYILLWNYDLRPGISFNNTETNWICCRCNFYPVKYFAYKYEKSLPVDINPHKIAVLDQLNRVRTTTDARMFAWILAGCLHITLKEILDDSFADFLINQTNTRKVYKTTKSSKIIEHVDETTRFSINNTLSLLNKYIPTGSLCGFPEAPLNNDGKPKWPILRDLIDVDFDDTPHIPFSSQ